MEVNRVLHQLHHEDRLPHARSAKQTGVAAAGERREEVDHLEAGLEHVLGRPARGQLRRGAEDRPALAPDGPEPVQGLTQQVEHAPPHGLPHRHAQGAAGRGDGIADREPVGVAEDQGLDPLGLVVKHHLEQERAPPSARELEHMSDRRALTPREVDLHDRAVHRRH